MWLQLQEILTSSNQSPFAPHENPLGQKSENREVEPCGEMVSEKQLIFFRGSAHLRHLWLCTRVRNGHTLYPCMCRNSKCLSPNQASLSPRVALRRTRIDAKGLWYLWEPQCQARGDMAPTMVGEGSRLFQRGKRNMILGTMTLGERVLAKIFCGS